MTHVKFIRFDNSHNGGVLVNNSDWLDDIKYIDFLRDLINGDLGQTLINQESVKEIIARALPATLELSISAMFIAMRPHALVTGFVRGVRRNRCVLRPLKVYSRTVGNLHAMMLLLKS